jgi:hypothetical protein
VGFFDDLPAPPRPSDPRRVEYQPWHGPPPGWIGGYVPWRLLFGEDSDSFSFITEFEAFPTGVRFSIVSRYRPGGPDADPRSRMREIRGADGPRFGVGFADGRKALSSAWFSGAGIDEPTGPVLVPQGGGGGGQESRMGFWLWPLPPPGPVTFVSAWPARTAEERSVVADGSELVAAATQARQLWQVTEANPEHL